MSLTELYTRVRLGELRKVIVPVVTELSKVEMSFYS